MGYNPSSTGAETSLSGSTSGTFSQIASAITTTYEVTWPPAQAASSGYVLTNNGAGTLSWAAPASGGVTSVGLLDGSTTPIYTITNSPITSSGNLTFTLNTQSANTVFAGPSSGSAAQPTFRSLVSADIPAINLASNSSGGVTGILGVANGGTGLNLGASFGAVIAGSGSYQITTLPLGNTSYVSGILGTANGGTGQSSNWNQYGVVYGLNSTALASTSAGTAGYPLVANSSAAPTFQQLSLTAGVVGTLPISNGGTNAISAATAFANLSPLTTAGDLIYESSAPTPARLAIGTTGQVLTVVAGLPAWQNATSSGGTVTSVTFTGDGTVLSSTPSSAVTTSGTLTATLNTQSANTVLAGPTTGSAADPTFRSLVAADIPSLPYTTNVLPSAEIFVGNVSNVATAVAMSGDIAITNTGATTVSAIQGTTVSGTTGTGNVVFSASPTLTGTLTAASVALTGPTFTYTLSTNGQHGLVLTNTSTGLGASSVVEVSNGTDFATLNMFGSSYATSGYDIADGAALRSSGTGGLSLVASNASGTIGFYPGGVTSPTLSLATTGAATFTNATTFNGVVNAHDGINVNSTATGLNNLITITASSSLSGALAFCNIYGNGSFSNASTGASVDCFIAGGAVNGLSGVITSHSSFNSASFTIGGTASVTNLQDLLVSVAASHEATNNAAIADTNSYTGNWFIHQAGTDPSSFGGTLTSGIGSSTNGAFILNNSTNTSAVTIEATGTTSSYNFNLPATAGTTGQVLTSSGGGVMTWSNASAGSVTSVGFADTSTTPIYGVTNSPITSSGTIDITLNTQSANTVFAGPTTGSAAQPTFRSLVSADIPNNAANTTGTASNITATSNSTLTTLSGLTTASSLVSVGTITSGTWAGTTVAISHGGTGATSAAGAYNAISPMTTTGDMEYEASANTAARLAIGTSGQVLKVESGLPSWQNDVASVGITIDGAGSTITTGLKGFVTVPFGGTISEWVLIADQTGSIVVDVWKVTYAGYPGSVSNSITGTDIPTISSAQKNRNQNITAWTTTTVNADDILEFNVNSATTITRCNLVLKILKA